MESSGKYWIPVFKDLEKTCNVCLMHPKYVKAIKGKKTDKKDAKWIAELLMCYRCFRQKRSGGKKAIIAIARKRLTAIWHTLSKNDAYNAKLYRTTDKPLAARGFTTAQALAFPRNKGFLIADEETGEIA